MAIAKVEPLLTTRNVSGPFDYRLPNSMAGVGVGSILVVPFGRRRVKGVVVALAETSELPDSKLAEPLEALEAGVPADLVELGSWLAEEYCSTPARGLGLTLPPGIGTGADARRIRALTELEIEIAPEGEEALTSGARLGLRQKAVLRALLGGPKTARRLANDAGADRAALRRLEERGLVVGREIEKRRRPSSERVGAVNEGVALNDRQRAAADAIAAGMEEAGSFLLHGVTGSGKTEVYLAAAEAALARGRGVIALVPEIALTPQTVARFQARFGDAVAVLHSRMSAGQRYDEWRRLRSGEARVCVGPRSAVFAPIADIGLIVIDEEHDSSYKQEGDPRYDARDVAAKRAADHRAVVVAGSATPRPESWRDLDRLELPERVDGIPLPPVEVVDMRGTRGALHERTLAALAEVKAAAGKAIVLINRRGWSGHLACRTCGHAWECPNCDVSLVMHRGGALRCHHCGHAEAIPESCPKCSSVTIARVGAGTERIESALEELLAPLPVFRLDSDSSSAGGHSALLRRFDQADAGVLVGTQMVSKGHDFPEVTLGVVLDADGTLRLPDFRAEERTFSLITQLAGRSGRGRAGGKVLVQTLSTGAPSIQAAAQHDSAGFLADELARRGELGYPPFSHLIEVVLASPEEERVEAAAERFGGHVAERLPADSSLLGPAMLFRRRGQRRRRLVVKSAERRPAVAAVRDAVEASLKGGAMREVSISVDVDPQ